MKYTKTELEAGVDVSLPAGKTVVFIHDGEGKTLATLDDGALLIIKNMLVGLKKANEAGKPFPDVSEKTSIDDLMRYANISKDD